MTPEAQRIAIAEACGWNHVHEYIDGPYGHAPNKEGTGGNDSFSSRVPDYLNDLNAMHEAEKTLHAGFEMFYIPWLVELTTGIKYDGKHVSSLLVYKATATQRAEAFLRTIGKWKDAP